MAKIRLLKGVRFRLDQDVYEINKVTNLGLVEVINLNTGITKTIKEKQIANALFEGRLRFECISDIKNKDPHDLINTDYKVQDFDVIEEKYRNTAIQRYNILKKIINMISREDRNKEKIEYCIKQAVEEMREDNKFGEVKMPGTSSVYRWLKTFEDANGDIRSLVPNYKRCGGKGKSRLEDEIENVMESVIERKFKNKQRNSIQHIYYQIIRHIHEKNKFRCDKDKLEIPSYTTVYRRVQQHNQYEIMKSRYGQKIADQHFGESKKGVSVSRPLERVEIDHTTLDLMLVDEEDRLPIGRPTLTYAVDKYTGYPLGFHVGYDPPSYYAVMMCLHHMIRPKNYVKEKFPEVENEWRSYGIPDTIVVDGGKDFQGKSLENACVQLGINIQDCPIRSPWFKGSIERHFRTLNDELVHTVPGTSFSNILDKGDYDPMKHACISMDEFLKAFHIWLIDFYAQKKNKGVNGIPAELWKEGIKDAPIAYPPNRDELIVLLAAIEHRTIQKYGIELQGIIYNSKELMPLRKLANEYKENSKREARKVLIKYNPNDLSRIYVYDDLTDRDGQYGQYIKVPAVNQEYTDGLSVWKHKVIKEYARKQTKEKLDEFALAEAKAKIEEIVNEEWSETKKSRGRKVMARYKQIDSSAYIDNEEEVNEVIKDHEANISIEDKGNNYYKGMSNISKDNIQMNNRDKNIEILEEEIDQKKQKQTNKKSETKKEEVDTQNLNNKQDKNNSKNFDFSDWKLD